MRFTFLLTSLVGLVASHTSPEASSPNAPSNDLVSPNLAFYTRMSFYSPDDQKASVVVEPPSTGNVVGATMHESAYPDDVNFCVTGQQADDIIVPWTPLPFNEKRAFDLSFPLIKFTPRDEPYPLKLWRVTSEGKTTLQAQTLLRLLPADHAKSFARQDRYKGDIYAQMGPSQDADPSQAQADELQASQGQFEQQSSQQQQAGDDDKSGKKKPNFKEPEFDSSVQKEAGEEKGKEQSPDNLIGTKLTPEPAPLLMEGPKDHSGSLPTGWWRKVMPATIHETTWDHVQKSWRTGNLTHYIENIKLGGSNILHPVHGQGSKTVPFEADLRYHLTEAANHHKVYVLFEVDFKSPGGSFKKYYTETSGPNKGGEASKEPESRESESKEFESKKPERGRVAPVSLKSSHDLTADAESKEALAGRVGRSERRHTRRQPPQPEDRQEASFWDPEVPQTAAVAADATIANVSAEMMANTPSHLALHVIDEKSKERIAWEAADTLRQILNSYMTTGVRRQSNSQKDVLVASAIQSLRMVVDSYFTPTMAETSAPSAPVPSVEVGKKDGTPQRRDSPRSVFAENVASIVEGLRQSSDADSTAPKLSERGLKCGTWFQERAIETTPWPCRLAEHEKAEIVHRFRRNLNDILGDETRQDDNIKVAVPEGPAEGDSATLEDNVMQQVHRDLLSSFQSNVRRSVTEWLEASNVAPEVTLAGAQPAPTKAKRQVPVPNLPSPPSRARPPPPPEAKARRQDDFPGQNSHAQSGKGEESDTWERNLLNEMHRDVQNAFEAPVQDEHRRALPKDSKKKWERVRKTRSLKKLLQDFHACANDPACNADTEDFVQEL